MNLKQIKSEESDSTGGDSALKSAFDLVLYRFEMAQMGPFLTMLMSILVLVRGLFQIMCKRALIKNVVSDNGANLVI